MERDTEIRKICVSSQTVLRDGRYLQKYKYMAMTGDQNAGRSNNIQTDNSSFERVEQFEYF